MKRFLITGALLLLGTVAVKAGDDKPINVNELPAKAKELIEKHFSNVKVSYAKVDKEIFDTTYEVIFVNGNKVEFAKNGDWKEVNCKYSQVPKGIVPQPIVSYISTNHQNLHVVEIDRDKRNIEVKLNNGLELKFDLSYNLIDIDS